MLMHAIGVLGSSLTEKGVTVNIYRNLYNKMKERRYEIKTFVNAVLDRQLKINEMVEGIKPYLSIVHMEEKSIFIKDEKQTRISVFEVQINTDKKVLECIQDKSENCVHTAFCLGKLGPII